MKHLFILLILLSLSAPAAAHHTKEHVLQPPAAAPPAPVEESGSQPWYVLGPFFLLATLGFVRWGLKHRAARRARQG